MFHNFMFHLLQEMKDFDKLGFNFKVTLDPEPH